MRRLLSVRGWLTLSLIGSVLVVQPVQATVEDTSRCDRAAAHAARKLGVPLPVMRAVTRVETGRSRDGVLQPWPWTVNLGGDGFWFDSPAEARAFAASQVARGRRNMDIGCFQVNLRWHGAAFGSTDEMFDPETNALYAAGFLKRLHDEQGDWERAVAAYHSRTPEYAQRYIARYRSVRAALSEAPPPEPGNGFPLLLGEGARSPGSLTPLGGQARPFLDLRASGGG
ncbi:lytic transglycosylase domain-containing protein [Salipiger mangrovisoli]|uniref:lytic transglycosylase domain-containing protein n=1 Tax=Salipiger mangrovisoli TaxID=2865933 RepID=UPI0030B860F3